MDTQEVNTIVNTSCCSICHACFIVFLFFFFQAEDGIRDVAVTGVQTCALPIFPSSVAELVHHGHKVIVEAGAGLGSGLSDAEYTGAGATLCEGPEPIFALARSEERRVGKECRSRWSPYH